MRIPTVWTLLQVVGLTLTAQGLGPPNYLDYSGRICSGDRLVMSCPPGYSLRIMDAQYGRQAGAADCPPGGAGGSVEPCRAANVTASVAGVCEHEQICSLHVQAEAFGLSALCPGVSKYMAIKYNCSQTVVTAVSPCSGDSLRLECPDTGGRALVLRLVDVSVSPACSGPARLPAAGASTNCSLSTRDVATVEGLCQYKKNCDICTNELGAVAACGQHVTVKYVCSECSNEEDDESCELWRADGQCEANPLWMNAFCRKACWRCEDTNSCVNRARGRGSWCDCAATRGDCETKPAVAAQCQYSCNQCARRQVADNIQVVTACEGSSVALTCGSRFIRVLSAFYGRERNSSLCGVQAPACPTSARPLLRTAFVCDGRSNCTQSALSPAYGDPCNDTTKYYTAKYTCQECVDSAPADCALKAANNQCEADRAWMYDNCFKSCSGCAASEFCENVHDSGCDYWAARGECSANLDWMLANCRRSCRNCTAPPAVACINSSGNDTKCEEYARGGECEANPEWMLLNCEKACSACSADGELPSAGPMPTLTTSTVPTTPSTSRTSVTTPGQGVGSVTCVNIHRPEDDCVSWAADGQCELNSQWMTDNCYKACSRCAPTSATPEPEECVNGHGSDLECEAWAAAGQCQTATEWMRILCRRACKLCLPTVPANGTIDGSTAPTLGVTRHLAPTASVSARITPTPATTSVEVTQGSSTRTTAGPKVTGAPTRNPTTNTQNITALTVAGSSNKTTEDAEGQGSTTKASTASVTDQSCINDYRPDSQCDSWARSGLCADDSWTQSNCRRSCGLCGQAPTAATSNQTLCENAYSNDADCDTWAGRNLCFSDSVWMSTNCAKACRFCMIDVTTAVPTRAAVVCRDNYTACDSWKSVGLCPVEASWMRSNCAKACGYCVAAPATPDASTPGPSTMQPAPQSTTQTTLLDSMASTAAPSAACENGRGDVNCRYWAEIGECSLNDRWMTVNCQRACGKCQVPTTVAVPTTTIMGTTTAAPPCMNTHGSDEDCEFWAGTAECELNRSWMIVNCKRSCGLCQLPTAPSTGTTLTDTPSCRNSLDDGVCQEGARRGQCRDFFLRDCRKACGVCQDVGPGPSRTAAAATTTITTATVAAAVATPVTTDSAGLENIVCRQGCVYGTCTGPDRCTCESGWTGPSCASYFCDGVRGCSKHGTCVGSNLCDCWSGWRGADCSIPVCAGNCAGNGICTGPNMCTCYPFWTGSTCTDCGVSGVGSACLPCPMCGNNGRCFRDGENTRNAYLGCFRAGGNAFSEVAWTNQVTSTMICIQTCHNRNFRYAATKNGHECRCSNTFERTDQQGVVCDVPCSNLNSRDICGGTAAMSVYKVQDGACVCNGNFEGRICDRCAVGWTGVTCEDRVSMRSTTMSTSTVSTTSASSTIRTSTLPTPKPTTPTTTTSTTRPTTTTTTSTTRPTTTSTTRPTTTSTTRPTTTSTTRPTTTSTTRPTTTSTTRPTTTTTTSTTWPTTTTTTSTTRPTTTTTTSTTRPTTTTTTSTTRLTKTSTTTRSVIPVVGQSTEEAYKVLSLAAIFPGIMWDEDYRDFDKPRTATMRNALTSELTKYYKDHIPDHVPGINTVNIIRFRSGSLIADYNVTFSQEVDDVMLAEVSCIIPRDQTNMIGEIEVQTPHDINDICNERMRCKNDGRLARKPSPETYYCRCQVAYIGRDCSQHQISEVETILIVVFASVLPVLGVLIVCCAIFVRRGDRGRDSKTTSHDDGTGTRSFMFEGMTNTKETPYSTGSKPANEEIIESFEPA